MRLRKAQKEAVLTWIAEGLQTDEINQRAAAFKTPFRVTRQNVDAYRKSRKHDLDAIKKLSETNALTTGFALREHRVLMLSRLAELIAKDLFGGFLWTEEVKGVGAGPVAEVVHYDEFNRAEVEAFRGVLDDIAAETSGRIRKVEGNGAGGAFELIVKYANDKKSNDTSSKSPS